MSEGALVTAAIRARAEAAPQDVALADDSGTRTWAEVAADLDRAAGALLAAAPESVQRVSVIGENAIPTLEAHAAALTVGVGTVATSRQLRAGELADQYADAGVVCAIAGPGRPPRRPGCARSSPTVPTRRTACCRGPIGCGPRRRCRRTPGSGRPARCWSTHRARPAGPAG